MKFAEKKIAVETSIDHRSPLGVEKMIGMIVAFLRTTPLQGLDALAIGPHRLVVTPIILFLGPLHHHLKSVLFLLNGL
jgi:hypothetical protein